MPLTVGGRRIDRIAVIGFGVTGRAVTRFAAERGVRVFVSENRTLASEDRDRLHRAGIEFEDGGHTRRIIERSDLIVLSPGVPPAHPLIASGRSAGLPILSEIDLAIAAVPLPPIIAVTGTDGKSTTTALIGALLRTRGGSVEIAGNIGLPLIAVADRASACDAIVLEVSSYQLEQTEALRPRVAVLLNIASDHLERHGSAEAYRGAKARIFRNQLSEDAAVLPSELADAFSSVGAGVRWFYDALPLVLPSWAGGLSPHNRANLRAALAAVRAFGWDVDAERLSAKDVEDAFRLPHRMEEVGSIGGVRVIDDSKATNPHATAAAIGAIDAPVVLLLGGRYKGGGYDVLAAEIRRRRPRRVIVFGEAAPQLSEHLTAAGIAHQRAGRMSDAIDDALRSALPGDVILLSPACSSFDEFSDFSERGDAFACRIRSVPGFVPP